MAGGNYTSQSAPVADINFNGGLNSSSGPLSLKDNQSSGLRNVDFDKTGSILKRNGYTALNTTAITGATSSDGSHWFEYLSTGTYTSKLLNITNGNAYKMDDLDGTWDDITGTGGYTATNFNDFDNWLNTVYITNNSNLPNQWNGTGNTLPMPAFGTNYYSFKVSGVTVTPTATATYTNNAVTFTVQYASITSGAGTIIASGSSAPSTSGTLTKSGGTGDATITFSSVAANINIVKSKFVRQFNNYLFLANVTEGSTVNRSRLYWSNIKDDLTWLATSFIDISKDDGQQITGFRVLGDRIVVFKERSIYILLFTGDSTLPFVYQKTASPVGCIASFSIQEVENGLVFLSSDGLWYFDGNSSNKISMDIQQTFDGLNKTRLSQSRSMTQKTKDKYFISVPSTGQTNNDLVLIWDWSLNSFSVYNGMAISSMVTVYENAQEERIYFGDYSGFVYRMDVGADDYPLNVRTAINFYYYTNWKSFQDIVDSKGIPNIYIYYQTYNTTLTFSYSYDFEEGDTYSQSFSISAGGSTWDNVTWDNFNWAGSGGAYTRRDLDGRGKVVRFKFSNMNLGETVQIDGLGSFVHLETNV